MLRVVFEGLMLGLSAGVYCMGACLIFFMPYLVAEGGKRIPDNLNKILSFMSGRLIAYIAFALIAGCLSASCRNLFTARFSNICLIAASVFMIAYSLAHNFRGSVMCEGLVKNFSTARTPFFLGLFTGLNPCPPFLVGAARLWTLHSVAKGVALFAAFFVGASFYMAPLIFVSYINKSERVRQVAAMVALLSGVWFLFVGISGLAHV